MRQESLTVYRPVCVRRYLALTLALSAAANMMVSAAEPIRLPDAATLHWRLNDPFLAVDRAHVPHNDPRNPWFAVKDPSIVRVDDRWHLFATLRRSHGQDGKPPGYIRIGYLNFADWSQAQQSRWSLLEFGLGYQAAPQVFYFRPQQRWYLIYQLEDPARQLAYGPCFSTSTQIDDPHSWTPPTPLYPKQPASVDGWLDFWVICDESDAHLFFTSLNGKLWRAHTSISDFPRGFSEPEVALEGPFFEASHTYHIRGAAGDAQYLTLIEAKRDFGGRGRRYYTAYQGPSLSGPWTPWADSAQRPFAGTANVLATRQPWTDSISHGELLRASNDERLEIPPGPWTFVIQGLRDHEWPNGAWRLGILEQIVPEKTQIPRPHVP